MMCMEHSYVLSIEQLLNLAVPERGQYIRVLYSEVQNGFGIRHAYTINDSAVHLLLFFDTVSPCDQDVLISSSIL